MSREWVAVIVGGIGTFSMRASFLMAAHRMADVPPLVQRILRQIPPAALASLVLPAFLRPEGHLALWTPELGAGLVAGLVAWKTRNSIVTLVVGLALLLILRAL